MKQKITCIYAIKDLRNEQVIYIGETKDFKKRKQDHFGSKSTHIDKYIFEQGRENFEMCIIKKLSDDISKEEILNLEDKYILKYNTIECGLNKRITNAKNKFFQSKFKFIFKTDKVLDKQNELKNKTENVSENTIIDEITKPFFMTKRYREMMEQFEKTTLETIKENLYCK